MSVQDWGDSSIALPLASQALTSTTECQRKHKRAPHAMLYNVVSTNVSACAMAVQVLGELVPRNGRPSPTSIGHNHHCHTRPLHAHADSSVRGAPALLECESSWQLLTRLWLSVLLRRQILSMVCG